MSFRNQQATRLEIAGQFAQGRGGDVLISGGDGDIGGSVYINGGQTTSQLSKFGSVKINSFFNPKSVSKTDIGSDSKNSDVTLLGNIAINKDSDKEGVQVVMGGVVQVAGSAFTVMSNEVVLGNAEVTNHVNIEGKDIIMGSVSPKISVGSDSTSLTITGKSIAINSVESIHLGANTSTVSFGSAKVKGQQTFIEGGI